MSEVRIVSSPHEELYSAGGIKSEGGDVQGHSLVTRYASVEAQRIRRGQMVALIVALVAALALSAVALEAPPTATPVSPDEP
jgi:hypothetical protein